MAHKLRYLPPAVLLKLSKPPLEAAVTQFISGERNSPPDKMPSISQMNS